MTEPSGILMISKALTIRCGEAVDDEVCAKVLAEVWRTDAGPWIRGKGKEKPGPREVAAAERFGLGRRPDGSVAPYWIPLDCRVEDLEPSVPLRCGAYHDRLTSRETIETALRDGVTKILI